MTIWKCLFNDLFITPERKENMCFYTDCIISVFLLDGIISSFRPLLFFHLLKAGQTFRTYVLHFFHICPFPALLNQLNALRWITITFAKLAVNRTHSKSSPILFRNSSTCGRFRTYTWKTGRRSFIERQNEGEWGQAGERSNRRWKLFMNQTLRAASDLLEACRSLPEQQSTPWGSTGVWGRRSWTKSSGTGFACLNKPILDYLNQAQSHEVCHPTTSSRHLKSLKHRGHLRHWVIWR